MVTRARRAPRPTPAPSPSPSPGGPVRYVSPSGSDGAACTQAAPCRSMDRAYRVAQPGETVELAGGSYPAQTVNADGAKAVGSADVLFRPAAGATVTLGDLRSFANDVHYLGLRFATGGQPNVKGGDYGPYVSCSGGSQITPYDPDETRLSMMPRFITIDGVVFHDYSISSSCPSAHLDCLHIMPAADVTVRNSQFYRCQHLGLLLNSNGPGNVENDVIENNFFGQTAGAGFALREGAEDFENVQVRYNSGSDIIPQTDNVLKNVRWTANATEYMGPCRSAITYEYNVAGDHLHLKPGAAAIDRGKPGDYPAADIDGNSRPQGSAADAGADEATSAT